MRPCTRWSSVRRSLRLYVLGSHPLGQRLAAGVESLQLAPRGLERGLRSVVLRRDGVGLRPEGVEVVHPEADLGHAQLVAEVEIALRDLGLLLQRLDLQLKLLNLVVDAQEVSSVR